MPNFKPSSCFFPIRILQRCELLFQDGDLIEIDHITPKSEGGGEELSNKFALHRHCHDERHANVSSVLMTKAKSLRSRMR